MLGYAVTCTADSTTEGRPDGADSLGLWAVLEAAPKPAVLVIKDVGPDPRKGCHMGEVMATTAKALGAVGCVSDGALRDVKEVAALGGFQYFCPGFVVSHGQPVILEVNVTVAVDGLPIAPGICSMATSTVCSWCRMPSRTRSQPRRNACVSRNVRSSISCARPD